MVSSFSQSFSDVRAKLKCLGRGALTPQAKCLSGGLQGVLWENEKAPRLKTDASWP